MLERESRIRDIGYGAMITEMMVALMAMIAACVIQPGEYFAINTKGTPTEVVAKVSAAGFPVTEPQMADLARNLGEQTMFNRAGGAPTFAVGMAHMFARVSAGPTALALWYHFAIMFEALFILTTIDAGTRVGRFLLQDLLGKFVATAGQHPLMDGEFVRQYVAGGGLGLVLVSGCDRSARRHQHPLAALRSGEPVAFGDRALSRHDIADQDGKSALSFCYNCSAAFHGCSHFFGRLHEDFLARPKSGSVGQRANQRFKKVSRLRTPSAAAVLIRQADDVSGRCFCCRKRFSCSCF